MLLTATSEMAWKQDWVLIASNNRVMSSKDLTEEEARRMINYLHQAKSGERPHLNPAMGVFNERAMSADQFEDEKEKCQRLRRRILKLCHDMGWYIRNSVTNDILRNDQGKPTLDMNRINAWCVKHSPRHMGLNFHNSEELGGKGGLVFQFKTMAKNYTKNEQ